jgi:endo-1,3(4)-beta-glucanase
VYTAAVIGHLDPSWLDQGTNKGWVNSLVRDYANPVSDQEFPFQRSFDWFHGHSWAKGLFESGDGKDQESTSEDTFATYALKMWGKIIQDPNMEARGNLQLAVQKRSLRNYFLLESNNQNQPERFLPNKVTGILFENKVDHTTYFGGNIEYVQGIHMIPLNPSSAYTRGSNFVREEWNTYFSNGRAENVNGGWRSILKANQALIDAQASYDFFASPNFSGEQLDGGASRTWYLAYSAALLQARSVGAMEDPQMNYTSPEQPLGPVQPPVQSGPVVNGPLPLPTSSVPKAVSTSSRFISQISQDAPVPTNSQRPVVSQISQGEPVAASTLTTSQRPVAPQISAEMSEFNWPTAAGEEAVPEPTPWA